MLLKKTTKRYLCFALICSQILDGCKHEAKEQKLQNIGAAASIASANTDATADKKRPQLNLEEEIARASSILVTGVPQADIDAIKKNLKEAKKSDDKKQDSSDSDSSKEKEDGKKLSGGEIAAITVASAGVGGGLLALIVKSLTKARSQRDHFNPQGFSYSRFSSISPSRVGGADLSSLGRVPGSMGGFFDDWELPDGVSVHTSETGHSIGLTPHELVYDENGFLDLTNVLGDSDTLPDLVLFNTGSFSRTSPSSPSSSSSRDSGLFDLYETFSTEIPQPSTVLARKLTPNSELLITEARDIQNFGRSLVAETSLVLKGVTKDTFFESLKDFKNFADGKSKSDLKEILKSAPYNLDGELLDQFHSLWFLREQNTILSSLKKATDVDLRVIADAILIQKDL